MILSLNLYKIPGNLPEWLVLDPTKPGILREYQEQLKMYVPGNYVFLHCEIDHCRVWVLVNDTFEIMQLMEYT